MCGIAGIFGRVPLLGPLNAMLESQRHRGPDACGCYFAPSGQAALGHNRLSIIDLSQAGRQPMPDASGRYHIVFNGEIYNYLELRRELAADYEFRTRTDTEVLLAAYCQWGAACLDKLLGMFAFLVWDEHTQTAFAARDRFGVKPFYYPQRAGGALWCASEIKALHAAGHCAVPNVKTWADYLVQGLSEHTAETFWQGITALPPGHTLTWRDGHMTVNCWYDLAGRVAPEYDTRPEAEVQAEYLSLLQDSVRLRFRADVPVGINLSGGLDSSVLLGLVQAVQGPANDVKAFTFTTGDARYDELPWVRQTLAQTQHPLAECRLTPAQVPDLAVSVQHHEDEPFGGLPTLAYANLFAQARAAGVIVLLDGNGLDEQWAGYDYYAAARNGAAMASLVQGTRASPVRPDCLTPELRALATPLAAPQPFPDRLRNLQYRDARLTKLPRALRFNDRISLRAGTELREPFLDHRLFELALRQPPERKIAHGVHKKMLRQIARTLLPDGVVEAPKRPLQTPQREWLRGPLREWAGALIEQALHQTGGAWLDAPAVRRAWQSYCAGQADNSFYIWQWLSVALLPVSAARTEAKQVSRSVHSLAIT